VEVPNTMNPVPWLRKHLEEGDPDLLRGRCTGANHVRPLKKGTTTNEEEATRHHGRGAGRGRMAR